MFGAMFDEQGVDQVEVSLEVVHTTEAACLLTDGVYRHWVAKSQIIVDDNLEGGKTYPVTLPEWLAIKNGWV